MTVKLGPARHVPLISENLCESSELEQNGGLTVLSVSCHGLPPLHHARSLAQHRFVRHVPDVGCVIIMIMGRLRVFFNF